MAVISEITGLVLLDFNSLRRPAGSRFLSNFKNDLYLNFLNNGQKLENEKYKITNPHSPPLI